MGNRAPDLTPTVLVQALIMVTPLCERRGVAYIYFKPRITRGEVVTLPRIITHIYFTYLSLPTRWMLGEGCHHPLPMAMSATPPTTISAPNNVRNVTRSSRCKKT